MSFISNVVRNPTTIEYGKFVEIANDSRFPAVSVVRYQYADSTEAFNWPLSTAPLSTVDIYPKYGVITYLANPEDIKVSLSAENINVNVSDIENLLKETNTLLAANSSNTSYLIPKAYTTVATTALTSKYFTNFGGVSGYLKNVKGINTSSNPSLPSADIYLQIWSGDNNISGPNSKLLFTYSVPTETNFDIVFPDGLLVNPLWIVSSLSATSLGVAPDSLFLTITYTT